MFNLFLTKEHPINYAVKKYATFEYISRRYLAELTKIILYYRNRTGAVDNTNIFSRIITLASPDIDLNIGDYFKYTDANVDYITRQFKLTSNISMGIVHNNIFYKDNEYTIIRHINTDINISKLKDNWINRSPIRVIYTTETDIDFYILDKHKIPNDTTITIVEIDTTLMLLMYRYWTKERLKEDRSINPNYFVYNIVLPNTIKTMLDIVLFNRLRKLYYKESMKDFRIHHPFNVLDYSSNIDRMYRLVLDNIVNTPAPLEQILYTIPTMVYPTMLNALYINSPIYNKNSEWVIWIARLEYIVFLLDLLGERGISRNREYVYRLPVMIKTLENRSTTVLDKLPNEMITMFNYYIEEIKRRVGRR